MVRTTDILKACVGFQWDGGNAAKNWDRHQVSEAECEQVFFNVPLLVKRDRRHAQVEPRYYALGCTDADRLLFASCAVRGDLMRVISARDMTPKEASWYRP